ncbi:MAG: hypothetical protein A2Y58_03185 [Chloroflexi bacterium RBG_13_51_52]|nr:MAG: hypothetical protein A2Y58_03185 [Chloroflexi bacterium RBG_13_51_52]
MKWVIRILIIIILIMAIVFLVLTCSGGGSCIKRIDEMPPDVEIAAWEIPTHSKLYYAEKVSKFPNGDVRLFNWYEPFGKKWIFHSGYETLPKVVYGTMTPRRR